MPPRTPWQNALLTRLSGLWQPLNDYFLSGFRRQQEPVDTPERLGRFLETRASYLAQTSLYGYLRTRAGMRYPELFEDDPFVVQINTAKWHMWLACLSDLAVYSGGLLHARGAAQGDHAGLVVTAIVDGILENTGIPADAGAEFPAHAERVRQRLRECAWETVTDDEQCFSESPPALVRWAPVVDEFRMLDEEIIRNSVRFHWHEVRRHLREHLDAAAIMEATRGLDEGALRGLRAGDDRESVQGTDQG